ncbi:unnamed protein product [Mesocestoides corti]|uniref:Uncharacterized protein n=1 Tax=Mesocestoides corti TaxID=53468 RepID=A0A0R3UDT1_MESCO|nr:unnamed protein product [Mesocestoides corti]
MIEAKKVSESGCGRGRVRGGGGCRRCCCACGGACSSSFAFSTFPLSLSTTLVYLPSIYPVSPHSLPYRLRLCCAIPHFSSSTTSSSGLMHYPHLSPSSCAYACNTTTTNSSSSTSP